MSKNVSLRWSSLQIESGLPEGRWGHALCQVSNKYIVVVGGLQVGRLLNDAWVFNIETGKWARCLSSGTPPTPRWGHSVTMISSRLLLLMGGREGSKPLSLAEYYILDLKNMVWTRHEVSGPAPRSRYIHGAVFLGSRLNQLLIFGGHGGRSRYYNDVHILQLPSEKSDDPTTSLSGPDGRPGMNCPTSSSSNFLSSLLPSSWLKAIPGLDSDQTDTQKFIPGAAHWKTPSINGVAPSKRSGHTLTIDKDRLYIMGGYNGKEILNDLVVLDLSTWSWSTPTVTGAGLPPLVGHSAESLPNSNSVIIFGGSVSANDLSGSLYILDVEKMSTTVFNHPFTPDARFWHRTALIQPSSKVLVTPSGSTAPQLRNFSLRGSGDVSNLFMDISKLVEDDSPKPTDSSVASTAVPLKQTVEDQVEHVRPLLSKDVPGNIEKSTSSLNSVSSETIIGSEKSVENENSSVLSVYTNTSIAKPVTNDVVLDVAVVSESELMQKKSASDAEVDAGDFTDTVSLKSASLSNPRSLDALSDLSSMVSFEDSSQRRGEIPEPFSSVSNYGSGVSPSNSLSAPAQMLSSPQTSTAPPASTYLLVFGGIGESGAAFSDLHALDVTGLIGPHANTNNVLSMSLRMSNTSPAAVPGGLITRKAAAPSMAVGMGGIGRVGVEKEETSSMNSNNVNNKVSDGNMAPLPPHAHTSHGAAAAPAYPPGSHPSMYSQGYSYSHSQTHALPQTQAHSHVPRPQGAGSSASGVVGGKSHASNYHSGPYGHLPYEAPMYSPFSPVGPNGYGTGVSPPHGSNSTPNGSGLAGRGRGSYGYNPSPSYGYGFGSSVSGGASGNGSTGVNVDVSGAHNPGAGYVAGMDGRGSYTINNKHSNPAFTESHGGGVYGYPPVGYPSEINDHDSYYGYPSSVPGSNKSKSGYNAYPPGTSQPSYAPLPSNSNSSNSARLKPGQPNSSQVVNTTSPSSNTSTAPKPNSRAVPLQPYHMGYSSNNLPLSALPPPSASTPTAAAPVPGVAPQIQTRGSLPHGARHLARDSVSEYDHDRDSRDWTWEAERVRSREWEREREMFYGDRDAFREREREKDRYFAANEAYWGPDYPFHRDRYPDSHYPYVGNSYPYPHPPGASRQSAAPPQSLYGPIPMHSHANAHARGAPVGPSLVPSHQRERDMYREREHWEYDRERDLARSWEWEKGRDRERERERERDREIWEWERERERSREMPREFDYRERDREPDRDRNRDRGSVSAPSSNSSVSNPSSSAVNSYGFNINSTSTLPSNSQNELPLSFSNMNMGSMNIPLNVGLNGSMGISMNMGGSSTSSNFGALSLFDLNSLAAGTGFELDSDVFAPPSASSSTNTNISTKDKNGNNPVSSTSAFDYPDPTVSSNAPAPVRGYFGPRAPPSITVNAATNPLNGHSF